MKNESAPTQFATDWTETYGYEAERNYLTSFSTTDGLAGASKTWSYDAAGNRNDATAVDNLNRLTAMSTTNYTNDILGNRLTRTYSNGREATTTWDCLSRMLSYKYYTNTVTTYDYRADGLRTHKAKASTHNYYRYDGQMGMQDVEVKPGVLNITNYGLGARGVDIGSTNGDVWYPVYDGHGNMVATLSKSGSGYNVSNRRSYDPWGNLRLGSIYTEPNGRYCANLGHKTDDESAMIYMRARYYEPSAGRFISEDRVMSRANWYIYCNNNPVTRSDRSGNIEDEDAQTKLAVEVIGAFLSLIGLVAAALTAGPEARTMAWAGLIFLAGWFEMELTPLGQSLTFSMRIAGFICMSTVVCGSWLTRAFDSSIPGRIIETVATYMAIISVFLSLQLLEDQ